MDLNKNFLRTYKCDLVKCEEEENLYDYEILVEELGQERNPGNPCINGYDLMITQRGVTYRPSTGEIYLQEQYVRADLKKNQK